MRIGYNTIRSAYAEFAGVAQLVERVIGNDEVHGSDSHHQLQTENHPKGWFFVWKLQRRGVGAAARRCREKSQRCCDLSGRLWGAGELRSAERKQACRSEPKDSHHQLQTKNHPKGWFFVWKLQRRGVGAAARRCREKSQQCCDLSGRLWGAGELRSAERKQACRSEPKDSHHQLQTKNHPKRAFSLGIT